MRTDQRFSGTWIGHVGAWALAGILSLPIDGRGQARPPEPEPVRPPQESVDRPVVVEPNRGDPPNPIDPGDSGIKPLPLPAEGTVCIFQPSGWSNGNLPPNSVVFSGDGPAGMLAACQGYWEQANAQPCAQVIVDGHGTLDGLGANGFGCVGNPDGSFGFKGDPDVSQQLVDCMNSISSPGATKTFTGCSTSRKKPLLAQCWADLFGSPVQYGAGHNGYAYGCGCGSSLPPYWVWAPGSDDPWPTVCPRQ